MGPLRRGLFSINILENVLEICNLLIIMAEFYSELGALVVIQQRNVEDAGEEGKDEDGEK